MARTVCITGATDGIGRALAEYYAAQGVRLLLIGRRPLAELDSRLFQPENYCQVDLREAQASAVISTFLAERRINQIDLLIQSAGIGSYGPIEQEQAATIDAILETNLIAPLRLTHTLFPQLARARGCVVLIGSVVATLPTPDYAVYAASKAALEGFARSVRIELGKQVAIQIIHPGATRTQMHAKSGAPLARIGWQRFPAAEPVAAAIVREINRNQPIATIGVGNRLLRFLGRYAEPLIDWLVARRNSP
jgi:short-subunit dehydrogenase